MKTLIKPSRLQDPVEMYLSDDVLIYHLKMRNMPKDAMIPGLAKDKHDDFKTALLKERGIIK